MGSVANAKMVVVMGDRCLHSHNSSTVVALLEMGLMILNLATKELYQLYHWLSLVTNSTMGIWCNLEAVKNVIIPTPHFIFSNPVSNH